MQAAVLRLWVFRVLATFQDNSCRPCPAWQGVQQKEWCKLDCSSTPCGNHTDPASRQLLATQTRGTAPYLNWGRPFRARFIFRLVPSLSMSSTCLLNAALKLCCPASHRSQGVPCTDYAKPPMTIQIEAQPH